VVDGELVSLQSSPVTSEGNEGDFVLVQRPSGVEGWTKLKNVHLPGWLPHQCRPDGLACIETGGRRVQLTLSMV